jgi:hypothetical protein
MRLHWAFAIVPIVSGLASGQSWAEITDSQKPFSMLCVAEKAIGFDWQNNDWVQSNYKQNTYVLTKLDGQDKRCFPWGGNDRGGFHVQLHLTPLNGANPGGATNSRK